MTTAALNALDDLFGDEVIYAYTRAQAIEDGELVDVTETATEAGFTYPVALTRAAWVDCVKWTEEAEKRKGFTGQDERGRLWDVVMMCRFRIQASRASGGGSDFLFELRRVPQEGRGLMPRRVVLRAVCGPGDNAEPVITIMQPDES